MNPVARRVVRNILYVFSSQVLNRVILGVFGIYAARMLGVKDYGVFALVGSITYMAGGIANLGIRPMIVRRIIKDKGDAARIFSNVLCIRFFSAVLVYCGLIVFTNLYGYSHLVRLFFYVGVAAVLLSVFIDRFEAIYVG
ncbi:MAG: oligosaccharide flippase family protein, partial [Deltaproteobacteria bacterium]|nr:oligosaccharide flippase family protein [Deltaproteobacteria bacterium]